MAAVTIFSDLGDKENKICHFPIIPRLIHRFKANSIKISVGIFTQKIEIDKPLLNFIQKGKETRIAKTNC